MLEITTLPCPTCQTTVEWNEKFPFRPFCCERCKLIDLGEWASESHVIAGNPVDPMDPMSDNREDY